jgi:hypothetical protein
MNTSETDKKLQRVIKGIKLESPGPDFTSKVMEAIFNETLKKPGFVTEPLLGKRFWILVTLFIGLAATFVLVRGVQPENGSFHQFFSKFQNIDLSPVINLFSVSFSKTGSMTWTLIIVILGASGLIFADKLFTGKHSLSVN